ncbi:MAG: MBL fold metallo-hydrolase [Hyphomicrobiaceae bacterium]|nr:MBL fold metallo-hydrolase [Hyphomicrobiaceae bacterium]
MAEGLTTAPALARAALKGTQAPGYFRFKVGRFEVSVLSDGNLILPTSMLATNVTEVELKAMLKASLLDPDRVMSHLNAAIINTGDALILVDVGAGLNFQATAGKLSDNLVAAGYKPDDVDHVILTHGHPDHIWGLTDELDGSLRFPKATFHIAEAEWEFWATDAAGKRLPAEFQGFALGARRQLGAIAARTKRLKPGVEIVPGVTLLGTHGHTPGHCSVVVSNGREKLLIAGDAITHAQVSFERPEWQPRADMDGAAGAATRKKLLDMLATDRMGLLGFHLPFPGVGRVTRVGNAYRWLPDLWRWQL